MPSDAEDMGFFEAWMEDKNKSYETQDEKLKRFQEFQVGLREIEDWIKRPERPLWQYLNHFADLTTEEFIEGYTGCEPDSSSEDEEGSRWLYDKKNDVFVKGKYLEDFQVEEEGTAGVKRKGLCCCDEKDTKELDAPEDGSVTVKRQRPCSCITTPAAADNEKEDSTSPVKPEPKC